jgi:hypothetical protein
MNQTWPKFRVYAVQDGQASGLLLKRKLSSDTPEEVSYFWLATPDGLGPTEEIIHACHTFQLSVSVETERFVRFLVKCTTLMARTGRVQVAAEAAWKGHDGKDCQRLIDHFFERGDQDLRNFFMNSSTFKKRVITKVREKEELIGNAEELTTISPHAIVVNGHYVKSISRVLNVGYGSPQWIRGEGPDAVDFDAGMIYPRREILDELKDMVLNNNFCLLEGDPATGKTVLVRQLGYELFRQDRIVVYWFDGNLERGFDKDRLINEINGAHGVFIIENVHLEVWKYQRLLHSVNPDPHRHVIFTGHPSFREYQNKADRKLSELNCITLDSSDEIDHIIAHFFERHPDVHWTQESYDSIKKICGGDLWALAYTLEGYVDTNGKGLPLDWLKHKALIDLKKYKVLGRAYPEIITTISALYQNEVLMEEHFLMENLGCDQDPIDELVLRGDVLEQEAGDGYVYYGLRSHTTLANLYWRQGSVYKRRAKLPGYEDFLYRYATSDVHNGLTAVLDTEKKVRKRLLSRLCRDRMMMHVVEREEKIRIIARWFSHMHSPRMKGKLRHDEDRLLQLIVRKIHACSDAAELSYSMVLFFVVDHDFLERLLQALDPKRLSETLSHSQEFSALGHLILILGGTTEQLGWKICELLNIDGLAKTVDEASATSLHDACWMISMIFFRNLQVGRKLWNALDRQALADKLVQSRMLGAIDPILRQDDEAGYELFNLLDLGALPPMFS